MTQPRWQTVSAHPTLPVFCRPAHQGVPATAEPIVITPASVIAFAIGAVFGVWYYYKEHWAANNVMGMGLGEHTRLCACKSSIQHWVQPHKDPVPCITAGGNRHFGAP